MPENEEELGGLFAPFTLEDAQEDAQVCLNCKHSENCAILDYVNKLSQKRDGRGAEDVFSCVAWTEEETQGTLI